MNTKLCLKLLAFSFLLIVQAFCLKAEELSAKTELRKGGHHSKYEDKDCVPRLKVGKLDVDNLHAKCALIEKLKGLKTAKQTMTLSLADSFDQPLDLPFEIRVTYEVIGNVVSLHIPAFSFDIPVDGFVYTIDGFLPRKIWPNDLLYQSFFAGNDNVGDNYQVHVTNAGSLIFLATEGLFFSPGAHQVQATTVTYLLTGTIFDCKPPKNVLASKGISNVVGTDNNVLWPFDYLEFHQGTIYNDKFAIWWPDNSKALSPNGRNHMAGVVRTGKIKYNKCGNPKIVFDGPPVIALPAPEGVFMVEGKITINPLNPNNMFIDSDVLDWRNNNLEKTQAGDPEGQNHIAQHWGAYSFDGGKTWAAQREDPSIPGTGSPGFAAYNFDGSTPIFDKFGNLWIASIGALSGDVYTQFFNGLGITGVTITIGVSTDGGKTFKLVGQVPLPVPADPDTQFFNIQDYPKATVGGDGQGGYAFYLNTTYFVFNFDGTGEISKYLTYVPITGLGQYGTIQSLQIPQTLATEANPLQIVIGGAEIAVGDNGKMMLWGESAPFCCLSPESRLVAISNPTGIVNFDLANKTTGDAFSGLFSSVKTNTGRNTLSIVPFQPRRTITNWGYGLAYDPDKDRFYASVVDEQPLGSGNMVLYLTYSDDNGQTWNGPVLISDTVKQARGLINMDRDPITGNILFSWRDARGQENQADVNTFVAILSKKELDKLPCLKSSHPHHHKPKAQVK